MKKTDKKTKWKYGLLAIFFIVALTAPVVFQFIDLGTVVEKDEPKSWYDPRLLDFLYEDTINQTSYNFNAYNESYIICKIQNTAYANFTLDEIVYNVSYGMNSIPIDFGLEDESYTITFEQEDINNDVYDWIVVQPVIVDSGYVDVNPTTTTDISFEAGGLVSLFLQWNCTSFNNFTYDELYVEYDGIVINEIREDWDDSFEVDPAIVSSLKFDGTYIQYDISMNPGEHLFKLKGNASIHYKLVVSGDWDKDGIINSEEIQKAEISPYYDIFKPTVWGYFEKGTNYKVILDHEFEYGLFNFVIPDNFKDQYLRIKLISGSITNIAIDKDDLIFKDLNVTQTLSNYPEVLYAGKIGSGIHSISYKYITECVLIIKFYINHTEIPVFEIDELSDKDCDNILDISEDTYGTDSLDHDTDNDFLPDGFDASLESSLILNNSKITEVIIPHNSSRDTLIDLTIKRFENDFTTSETKIWKDMEVSIVPMMRMFGNSTISCDDLYETYEKEIVSYDMRNENSIYPIHGDGVPDKKNPNLEFIIIKPHMSENSLTYTFVYNVSNSAKLDSKIIMRFDFVWTVVSHEPDSARIIHFYEIEEPILMQSFSVREVDTINYIMASPDSMIESQMVWNLVQNPSLGSFSDFGVSDDVVSSGNTSYSNFFNTLSEIRENNPISLDESGNIDENEVIYLSFLFSEYDLLQNISNQIHWTKLSEYQEKGCKRESYVSYYLTSDTTESQINNFFNGDNTEAFRLCYTKSFGNYSTSGPSPLEERFQIGEYPVYMKNISYLEANILETVSISGISIPLNQLPSTIESQIHERISFTNITLIENKNKIHHSDVPEISFDFSFDIEKTLYDSRILEVPLSDLMFNECPFSFLKVFYERISNDILFDENFWFDEGNEKWHHLMPEAWDKSEWGVLIPDEIEYENVVDNSILYLKLFWKSWILVDEAYIPTIYKWKTSEIAKLLKRTGNDFILEGLSVNMISLDEIFDLAIKKFDITGHIISNYNNFFDLLNDFQLTSNMKYNHYIKCLNMDKIGDLLNSYTNKLKNKYLTTIAYAQNLIDDLEPGAYRDKISSCIDSWNNRILEIEDLEAGFKKFSKNIGLEKHDALVVYLVKNFDLDPETKAYYLNKIRKKNLRKTLVDGILFDSLSAGLFIFMAILDFQEASDAYDEGDMNKFERRMQMAWIKIALAICIFAEFAGKLARFLPKATETLKHKITNYIKFCGIINLALSILLDMYVTYEYLEKIWNCNDFNIEEKNLHTAIVLILAISATTLSIVAILGNIGILTLSTASTFWIPIVGIALSIILIIYISVIFPTDDSVADLDISNLCYKFPSDNIKKHGSLEVGDEIKFNMDIENTGTETAYVRTRLSAGEEEFSDWVGDWSSGYTQGFGETLSVSSTLNTPQTYLSIKSHNQIDVDINDERTTVYDDVSENILSIPILDANIEDFYDDLDPNPEKENQRSYHNLITEFQKYKDSLEHNKTAEAARKLSSEIKYDFLGESVGEIKPTNWDVTDSHYDTFTTVLRPNSDESPLQWMANGVNHYAEIDEPIYYGDPGDAIVTSLTYDNMVYFATPGSGSETFGFEDITDYFDVSYTCFTVVVYVRITGSDWYPSDTVDFYISIGGEENDWPLSIDKDDFPDWQSPVDWTDSWYVLPFSNFFESDISDLEIRVYSGSNPIDCKIWLDTMYAVAYYYNDDIPDHTPEIVSNYKGHNNVMNVTTIGEEGFTEFTSTISRTSGIIDFWLCKDTYSNVLFDKFFQIDRLGSILNFDGTEYVRKRPIQIDEWTHFSVDFDSDSFDLYVNGVQCADDVSRKLGTVTAINFTVFNNFNWYDSSKHNISVTYIDSVDYSWDTNYYLWRSFAWDYSQANITYYQDIYDNLAIKTSISTDLRENIIEMSTTTNIAEFAFDFDLVGTENPNIDIVLFNVPEGFVVNVSSIDQSLQDPVNFKIIDTGNLEYAGIYYFEMNITLYGDDTIIYYEKIPFVIPYVKDLQFDYTNVIYEEDDIESGEFTATYDFLGDIIGENPSGWTIYEDEPERKIDVISSKDDHNKVVEMYDGIVSDLSMKNVFSGKSEGKIEFWIQKSSEELEYDEWNNNHIPLLINLKGSVLGQGSEAVAVQIEIDLENNGMIKALNDDTWENLASFTQDTWHHIRIDFICGEFFEYGTYNVYLNGKLIGLDIEFDWMVDKILELNIKCDSQSEYLGIWYIDAVGYSWDTDYVLGENKYETDTIIEDNTESQVAKGDVVNVEFFTNTYSEVQMKFVNNDVVQEIYTILPRGNSYSWIQTGSFIVDTSITFDEIQFTVYENNYFDVSKISIIDTYLSVSSSFNPVNITNDGNAPEFVLFSFNGIEEDSFVETIFPGETHEINLDTDLPSETFSNLKYRKVTYHEPWSDQLNYYIDNFEIDGIYIASPMNKTYNVIGEDYLYSMFYNFEKDIVGDKGTSIGFIDRYDSSGSSAYAQVVASYQGREKVLKLYDSSTSGNYNYHAYHDFTPAITYGTIEFWTASTAYSGDQCGSYWAFGNNAGGSVSAWNFIFSMDSDNNGLVKFYDGSGWNEWSGLYADNTWFHVRIDFESTDGGYLGLGNGECNFWFDGVLKRDAVNMVTDQGLEQIQFTSHGWDNTRHDYLDSMKITQKYEEKLLIDFIPEETLVSSEYSLDGGEKIAFTGELMIQMPETSGMHSIQVFGEDSSESEYQSELRNFTIQYPIKIVSPNETENKKFHEIVEDYDFFDSNDVNSVPEDWTVVDSNMSPFYISSIDLTTGTQSGVISNTETDDANYFTLTPAYELFVYRVNGSFTFNIDPEYKDFLVSYHIVGSVIGEVFLKINNVNWKTGQTLDSDNVFKSGINTVEIYSWNLLPFNIRIYFFKMEHDGTGNVEVVESMNGQVKPVQISNIHFYAEISMEHELPDSYEAGNVSFSILRESIIDKNTVLITLEGTSGTMVYALENDDLYYGSYSSKTLLASNVLKSDVWQQITIYFEKGIGCQIFVDGEKYVPSGEKFAPFSTGTPTDIDTFKIETVYHSGEDYSFWFDNFFLSKIKSGFKIDSINTFIYLDNLEYSIDGGSRVSFEDPEIVPFFPEGEYEIVIYGEDAYGNEYRSELLTFTYGGNYGESRKLDISDVSMVKGTNNGLNNMKEEDSVYTRFDSEVFNSPTWYSASWNYRRAITISSSLTDSTLTDFPFYFYYNDAHLANSQADGDDIIFTDSDGTTKLNHEIFYKSTLTVFSYVEIPSLPSAGKTIYMYYGNPSATNTQNPSAVWDDYSAVWHFENSGTQQDSTSNNRDLTNVGVSRHDLGEGHYCQYFDNVDDRLYYSGSGILSNTRFTTFFTMNPNSDSSTSLLYSRGSVGESQATNLNGLWINANSDIFQVFNEWGWWGWNYQYNFDYTGNGKNFDSGGWFTGATRRQSGTNTVSVWCDLVKKTNTGVQVSDSLSNTFYVGALSTGYEYSGYMDELYISSSYFSDDYVEAMSRQLGNNDGYRTVADYVTYDLPDLEFTAEINGFSDIPEEYDFLKGLFEFKLYATTPLTINIDIYNFDTSGYENKISQTITTNTLVSFEIFTGLEDYMDTVNDGFKFRIRMNDGSGNYDLFVDYISATFIYDIDSS